MTTRRLGVAVAVLGGYLYAIGGSDGQCPLNTVERYDSRYDTIKFLAPFSHSLSLSHIHITQSHFVSDKISGVQLARCQRVENI